MTVTAIASPARRVTCRYLDHHSNRCTGEAVDPAGEILLCVAHLARALELVRNRAGAQ